MIRTILYVSVFDDRVHIFKQSLRASNYTALPPRDSRYYNIFTRNYNDIIIIRYKRGLFFLNLITQYNMLILSSRRTYNILVLMIFT